MELATKFENSIPDSAVDLSPDGDNSTDPNDANENIPPSRNPPIADDENIVLSPSPEIEITHDFPRVGTQPTDPSSLPRVASPNL